MKNSRILGTGSYLPELVLTNYDLEAIVETSHDWMVERTGIHKRHLIRDPRDPKAPEISSVTHMAKQASLRAIEMAGIDKDQIDMIVFATISGDLQFPSAGCLLQAELGLSAKEIPAFDVTAVCSGFIYALSIADQYIKTGAAKHVLVVGSEAISRMINWEDRKTCVLFGDGAGAVILGESEKAGLISTHIHADGSYKDLLCMKSPLTQKNHPYIEMQGQETFKVAVNTLKNMFRETLSRAGLSHTDIDWLIPHQANIRIIQAIAKQSKLPMERVALTIDQHANTSAASIPLALDTVIRQGKVKRGDRLLLEAFGGGLTWGSAFIVY